MTKKISTRYLYPIESMIGKEFGFLKVISYAGLVKGARSYNCTCECGGEKVCNGSRLRLNQNIRCDECTKANKKLRKHRIATRRKYGFGHPLWHDWNAMRRQCLDQFSPGYKYFGAQGVTICDDWRHMEIFCRDMGEDKPVNTFLTRLDYTKPFQKDNCAWVKIELTERYKRKNAQARAYYAAKRNREREEDQDDDL